jgi:hypothetical protein
VLVCREALLKYSISLLLLLFSFNAISKDLSIELVNLIKEESFLYSLDFNTFKFNENKSSNNTVSSVSEHNYTIKDESLVINNLSIFDANEILFVKHFEDFDFVIIRETYSSFSNPLKLLVAVAGHPMQVTKIYALKIKVGKVQDDIRILKEDNASSWAVKVAIAN